MKTTLTSADPSGWYLCQRTGEIACPRFWDGNRMTGPYHTQLQFGDYTNFRRLFTESDVAALCQALAENEALVAESVKGAEQVNEELRTLREANERLSATLLEASAELSRLKSQPYEMRRADKPDCEGLWRNAHGDICKVKSEKDIYLFGEAPPYYLLGPIPVVVEQQPPRVVKVRCKKTGEELRAIPRVVDGEAPSYCLLNNDGTTKCFVTTNSVEEVQS